MARIQTAIMRFAMAGRGLRAWKGPGHRVPA